MTLHAFYNAYLAANVSDCKTMVLVQLVVHMLGVALR